MGRLAAVGLMGLLLAAVSGCTLTDASAPSLTGPSELGLSLNVSANPDVVTQDGFSQSRILITARDANGQPVRNVTARVEICTPFDVNGDGVADCFDFGQLSTRTVVTDGSGRAEVVYTAPPAPSDPVDPFIVISIRVTPVGTDFANAFPRSTSIRLVPPGIIIAPNSTPIADFTFSQPATEGSPITFDASISRDADGTIVSYAWEFGDGTTGSGVRVVKTYARGADYNVTLTVTDDRGLSASRTKLVSVTTTAAPTATFSFSPTSPAVNEPVFFNASASTAAAGRRIVSYDWTFGDGGQASGVIVDHRYAQPASYAVTLTVTDDAGRKGTASQTVNVGVQGPTASFNVSPSPARVNQPVVVDGSPSTAQGGATIVDWAWNFGDSTTIFSAKIPTYNYTYSRSGIFTITLTVTDSRGRTATATKTLTVDP